MIFLDVETKTPIFNNNTKELEISYIGVIDSTTDEEIDIWENDDDFQKLKGIFDKGDIICGYNIFFFDMPVIANYLGEEVNELPMLDLMVAAHRRIGYRPKLDHIATATLKRGKTGHGLDAVRYYKEGELQKLRDYCMEDVRLTKEVYDYGIKHKKISYYDRNGFNKETSIDWKEGYRNVPVEDKIAQQGSLF
jgi:DEAD/DEAH box helicase domain-containing protein